MDIQTIYTQLLLSIGFSKEETQKNWTSLVTAYTKEERYYHTLEHLEKMISSYEKYKKKIKYPLETLYAIFYHDIVYLAQKSDNEQKSAEWAVSILPAEAKINASLVEKMILATKKHEPQEEEDINWLIDFDLQILASEREDYEIYAEQIRKEYKIYPDFLYRPGRRKALQTFMENTNIFQTKTFRDLYQAKARENLSREIIELKSKLKI